MRIIIAKPRGFCAGVERAILCVERALERYGAPVYVLNNIVHNAHVVEDLRAKGAVFVKDLAEVPEGAHLLFSAHGVGPDRWEQAKNLSLEVIDATCPLVEKVHAEARRFADQGHTVILVGEAGHDETVGTMGWVRDRVVLVQSPEEARRLEVPDPENLSYVTQTTLSVEDCNAVLEVLRERFPKMKGPKKEDICYATTNRQSAVKALAPEAGLVLVVGDQESANSTRLAEVARARGAKAHLIPDASELDPAWLEGVETVLLTSGASVPERLVQGVVAALQAHEPSTVEERSEVEEDVHFRLPKAIA